MLESHYAPLFHMPEWKWAWICLGSTALHVCLMTLKREDLQTSSMNFCERGWKHLSWSQSAFHVCPTGKPSHTDCSSPHTTYSRSTVNSLLYLISRKGLGCSNRGYRGNTKLRWHWPKTKTRKRKRDSMTSWHQLGMVGFSYVQFRQADDYWYHQPHHQPFQFAN